MPAFFKLVSVSFRALRIGGCGLICLSQTMIPTLTVSSSTDSFQGIGGTFASTSHGSASMMTLETSSKSSKYRHIGPVTEGTHV
ncbi:hypothetical protein OGATHE_002355 [Ogataea polymorpha]|uniref:Uncharacterized protein n=1 Tax=Ogataea polymorpha TaxID=460523 RepID=A0A9P8PIY4_9ASCO|nr:hypothetical protein OGATHE_002355 [Ogataea polymorpha]